MVATLGFSQSAFPGKVLGENPQSENLTSGLPGKIDSL